MKVLRERVQAALTDNPRTRDAAIDIVNNNGVITLGGLVPERDISTTAEAITENINGVISVINEIQVRENVNNKDPFDVSGIVGEGIIVK